MEILVVGNGFDLAHNLPTKYTDFLKYCKNYKSAVLNEHQTVSNQDKLNEEFLSFVKNNLWLKYFLDITNLNDDRTWIDFEKEISNILSLFDILHPDIIISEDYKKYVITYTGSDKKLNIFLSKIGTNKSNMFVISKKEIKDKNTLINYLFKELKTFSRAFEIYCLKINNIPNDNPVHFYERYDILKDIKSKIAHYQHLININRGYMGREKIIKEYEEEMKLEEIKKNNILSKICMIDSLSFSRFDCVLSFNYTNTYERLYGNERTKYCYIHGKAQENKDKSNLIFGIDDNLTGGKENEDFTWIKFKKYFQRIILKAESQYKEWLSNADSKLENKIYIVGHSLDRTDYDILYELFTNEKFKIIIFYYNQNDFEEKVQKVIKLLSYKGRNGRDELINRVHGENWTIKFVDQYDEKDGLFIK